MEATGLVADAAHVIDVALHDGGASLVDESYFLGRYVDTDHVVSEVGETGCSHAANVSESEDADVHNLNSVEILLNVVQQSFYTHIDLRKKPGGRGEICSWLVRGGGLRVLESESSTL